MGEAKKFPKVWGGQSDVGGGGLPKKLDIGGAKLCWEGSREKRILGGQTHDGGALFLDLRHELFILISSNDDRYTTITNFLVEYLLYLYYLNELWKCRYSECEIWLSIWMFEFSI